MDAFDHCVFHSTCTTQVKVVCACVVGETNFFLDPILKVFFVRNSFKCQYLRCFINFNVEKYSQLRSSCRKRSLEHCPAKGLIPNSFTNKDCRFLNSLFESETTMCKSTLFSYVLKRFIEIKITPWYTLWYTSIYIDGKVLHIYMKFTYVSMRRECT